MIKTMLGGGGMEPPRRTYVLGASACDDCGGRSGCSCDSKVENRKGTGLSEASLPKFG